MRFHVEGIFGDTGPERPFGVHAASAEQARQFAEDAGIRVTAVYPDDGAPAQAGDPAPVGLPHHTSPATGPARPGAPRILGLVFAVIVVGLSVWALQVKRQTQEDARQTLAGGRPEDPGAVLVGAWEGHMFNDGNGHGKGSDFGTVRYEFQAGGSYTLRGLTGHAARWYNPQGGTWKATRASDGVILVEATEDKVPNQSFVWRVTPKGPGEIVVQQPGCTLTLRYVEGIR